MGGVCDHINHLVTISQNLDIRLWKTWGPAMLKGPGENTIGKAIILS